MRNIKRMVSIIAGTAFILYFIYCAVEGYDWIPRIGSPDIPRSGGGGFLFIGLGLLGYVS